MAASEMNKNEEIDQDNAFSNETMEPNQKNTSTDRDTINIDITESDKEETKNASVINTVNDDSSSSGMNHSNDATEGKKSKKDEPRDISQEKRTQKSLEFPKNQISTTLHELDISLN